MTVVSHGLAASLSGRISKMSSGVLSAGQMALGLSASQRGTNSNVLLWALVFHAQG